MAERINLTFLGTSDSVPSAQRNHTAILLNYKDENILVDCGEGTQRQFRKARLGIGKITRILITHWHGDHVLGLPGILQSLALGEYNETLHIYGPCGIKKHLSEMLKVFPFYKNYDIKVEEIVKGGKFFEGEDFYLSAEKMTHTVDCNAYAFVKKGLVRIDKEKLKEAKIPPGPLLKKLKEEKNISYNGKKFLAKNLTYQEGDKKISFVLDTSDNKKIVSLAKDSDILVCEATFGEDMEEKAREHRHLTSRNAAEIAKKSNSKKLVLTHISQRYEKDSREILESARKVFKNSMIVKDLDVLEV